MSNKVVDQFKAEIEEMRKLAQPGDTMPAEVFFTFMDVITDLLDGLTSELDKCKEKQNGRNED